MKRLMMLLILMQLISPSYFSQSANSEQGDNIALQKLGLLSELQALDSRSTKLDKPLARAAAKAEIADAAWPLDQAWAKTLLKNAYELTLPDEDESSTLRSRPVGAALTGPGGSSQIARNNVRNRVLQVANRDRAFAGELIKLGAQKLGKLEEHQQYTELATKAIQGGDMEAAGNYALQAFDAEPTLISAGAVITDIAARDRPAADKLIIQYIERLRSVPLSVQNQSAIRIYFLLNDLIFNYNKSTFLAFNNRDADTRYAQIQPPGPAVMRAYINFIIESLNTLEQREPGSTVRFRGLLQTVWPLLPRYAPESAEAFLQLAQRAGMPGGSAEVALQNRSEANRADYDERVKKALDSDRPDEVAINLAMTRGDFDKARKMIEKLPDDSRKTELIETLNMEEAMSLATKGEILDASRLAEKLTRATSILNVYPLLVQKCVSKKDQSCATLQIYQAIKQLKQAKTGTAGPPIGAPSTSDKEENDAVTLSLSRLAKLIAPVDEMLALMVLDEMVTAANASKLDTGQGRIGFDADAFRKLAAKNEARTEQAAANLKDPLRQIIALAEIYQWRVEQLIKSRARTESS